MRGYTYEQRKISVLETLGCDRCKKSYSYDETAGVLEIQEFVHIEFVGGYHSVFGDGLGFSGDFCQHCIKELLGEFLVCQNKG